MFEFFPVELKSGFPTFVTAVYTLTWGLVLSSLIAITHKKTYTGFTYPDQFFQSMILATLVATAVMMSIGDSLARGLGIFGALAIIRFRTRIDQPKNLLFLFATLALGIALGVYGFSIAISSTLMFCAVAWLLYFSVERNNRRERFSLVVSMQNLALATSIEDAIRPACLKFQVVGQQKGKDDSWQMEWQLVIEAGKAPTALLGELTKKEGVLQVKWSKSGTLARV